ncbi:hypothetical protein KIN20_031015 [Parelaphostrongylus tenuis]|uniref:Uncharacterized protein n=1 Tax=Parelaphostrongylus tenuis TaxID=148309 RepID=A0AAD5WGW1_PARTN|nr:hypothetical protein KIN20_031015 [Parelaphostrongylus tenuis]
MDLSHSPQARRSSALTTTTASMSPVSFGLSPEPNQHHSDMDFVCDAGLTLLGSDRKRLRSDDDDSDIDDSRMSRISMKPDILTFYRTPGAFKFCRRTSTDLLLTIFTQAIVVHQSPKTW